MALEKKGGGVLAYQSIFQRYEMKYMISVEQKERILERMKPYMELDEYGRTVIRNIYYDTENHRLIRRSLERPVYKEKLRIRSYERANADSPVFVELKKKYESVVYKRRLSMSEETARRWLEGSWNWEEKNQIAAEISYFCRFYENLRPKVFLSYEREAFRCFGQKDFRVTFDDHILCRQEALSLTEDVWGEPLLEDGKVLMEVKTAGGIPLWMTRILTEEQIYKTSFSKYGTAYEKYIYQKEKRKNGTIISGVI